MRAFMWAKMKDSLLRSAVPSDAVLERDLTGPGYHLNRSEQLMLESKADMVRPGVASRAEDPPICDEGDRKVRLLVFAGQ